MPVDMGAAQEVRLYIVTLLWLPQADVLRGQAHNVAFGIDNTSSSATGTNVDANVVIHMYVQFIVRV